MTIYFMRKSSSFDAPIKIGYTSSDAEKRMSQLQTGHHERLYLLGTIPGTMSDEKAIHKELVEYHIQGEWFQGKPELLEVIADVVENQRSWYYFRQVKFNRVDIECRGLRELVIELRKTVKSLEDEKEALQKIVDEKFVRTNDKFVKRIGREVARRKALETELKELRAKFASPSGK